MAKIGKKDHLKKKKKKFDYYEAFETQTEIAVKEAKLLRKIVNEFESAEGVHENLDHAHKLEHEADVLCHNVYKTLVTDFVTPFDREDIIALTESLDDVIDRSEEIIQRFYMYDIHMMHEGAQDFADYIVRACETLAEAMLEFRNCKKSHNFKALFVQVKTIEDEADKLYLKLIRELYTEERDHAVRVMIWTRLFDVMEDCVDQCELVANKMRMVYVKYA